MILFLTLLLVGLAAAGIFALRPVVTRTRLALHSHPLVDFQLKFQSLQLILTAGVLVCVYLLNPANFARFFRLGDVHTAISPIPWLGVSGQETWLEIALTLGLFVTLGTAVFMFIQLKKSGANNHRYLFSLLWAVLFSITNAFSEEAIFRMGIVSPLYGTLPVTVIVLLSAFIFGIPHYFGMPKGVVGALMASFLGWLLALSLVETQGLLLAWAIHFVQDVVIFTTLLLMSSSASRGSIPKG
jgi:membrane protease YdiL (CAAX protease family)